MAPRRINTLTELQKFNSLYFCNVETNFKISQLKFSSRKCNLMHNFVLSEQSFTKKFRLLEIKICTWQMILFCLLDGAEVEGGWGGEVQDLLFVLLLS